MAYLIHYTGQGQGLLAGKVEYVEIVDVEEEELTQGYLEDHAAPGFEANGIFEIDDACVSKGLLGRRSSDSQLPLDRMMVALY